MEASLENPIYTVYLVDGSKKYNLTPAVTAINFSDQAEQLAQSVSITLMNTQTQSQKLSELLRVRQRVFIYADDGNTSDEVFRGWIWTRYATDNLNGSEIEIKCYDNLIYLQESESSRYFSKGKKTSSVMQTICKSWGISLNYNYNSIQHAKLVLRGTLSNIITADILDKVKNKTGKKYVILSKKDVMYINAVGNNTQIYSITAKNNVIRTRSEQSMDGMITKVVILGKAKESSKKVPVKATVKGDTATYGTLQKLIDKEDGTSLSDAKKEAQYLINDKGTPSWDYIVEAPDIPWIRKGDKVYVNAGDMSGYYITKSVDRDITNKMKQMVLTVEEPKNATIMPNSMLNN